MKKLVVLGMGVCLVLAFASCKSSESAYKKAYDAEGLKDWLDGQGYHSTIAFNADKAMYRVIVNSFADKTAAAEARDAFKAKYPNRSDFQGAWLLYRVY